MNNPAKKLFTALLCLVSAWSLSAQTTVKGVVTDETGEPLIGAGVLVEGTTVGTVTGLDGDYVLTLPEGAENLVFSFIGLNTQVVPVQGRSEIDVVLSADNTFLDEVVVVGYATVKRRDLLGSVSSVSSDKLAEQPVTTVSQALSGKMAGVSVVTTEGDPDADVKIRVRGGGSITQDSSPLYIVDGFPVDNINDIPSSEIASIDVLKDAFSTAIYGSRGANGVVIVTTKSAEKGQKVSVKLNAYYGMKRIANKKAIQVMDSENFVKFQYELRALSGQDQIDNYYTPYFGAFSDMDMFMGLPTNDWVQAVFGNVGQSWNTDLSVSGSSDNVNWTVGYAHIGDKAIMKGSNYSRDNLSFKTNIKTSKRTSIDLNARYSNTKVRGAGANSLNDNSGQSSSNGRLKHAVLYTPIPVSNTLAIVDDEEDFGDAVPPLRAVTDNDSRRLRTIWNVNAAFNWEIIDNLRLKIDGGLEDYRQIDDRFYGMSTYTVYNTGGLGPAAVNSAEYHKRYRNTNTLQFNFKDIITNPDHSVDVLIGEEMTSTRKNIATMKVADLPAFFGAEMAWNFIGSGIPNTITNVYYQNDNLLSFFGRVNYDYKHRYSVGATLRADGSSKFAKGNRWGFFPSAAVSWTISNEEFMDSAHGWLDQLKLRYSFGTAGNNNIPSGYINKEYSGKPVSDPTDMNSICSSETYWTAGKVMNNPDLTWETSYTHNIGLDFSFLQGRLTGSVEVYQNDTKNLLIEYLIKGVGYDSQFRNIGSTRNRGAELTLNAPIISKKDFSLNIGANISYNHNKVTSLGGVQSFTQSTDWASTEIGADYLIEVGRSLGNIYGYVADGFYLPEDLIFDSARGTWSVKPGIADMSSILGTSYVRPGAPKVKNMDDDPRISAADKTVIGNALPDFTGGFNLSGYIKGFDFSANFNFMIGNDVYNANKIEFNNSRKFKTLRNLTNMMDVSNRWTNIDWETGEVVNDAAKLSAMNEGKTMWAPFSTNAFLSDWAVEDGSFLRLQSLTLGYTLPEKLTSKIHLRRARVYVTGSNLFCLTGYSGYDPEVDTRRKTPMTPGVDCSAYPKSIGFVAGINLTF